MVKDIEEKDIVCSIIGNFGKWQFGISVMMALLKFSLGWFQFNIVFLAPPQQFWCKNDNFTISELKNQSNRCFDPYDADQKIPCAEFEFDRSVFTSTIVSEWNLVCTKQYFVELTQMSFMAGMLFGYILFGILADKYGRRKPLIIAIVIQAIACFLSTFSPWFSVFILARFVVAIASGGIAIISFVLCMEIVGGKWRTIIPILYQIPFGLANSVLSGLAFFIRDWRQLQLALSILSALYIFFAFFIPESPRWLLVTDQREKAMVLLRRVAKFNNRQSSPDELLQNESTYLDRSDPEDKKDESIQILFKNKNLRFKTIILSIEWFVAGMSFFAFTQYMGSLSDNIFFTFAMGGIVVIPGVFVSLLMSYYFGRKTSIVVFEVITAICFWLILAVPKGAYVHDWPRVLLASMGIIGMSVFLPMLYLYTGELFPTVVRNVGVGVVSMVSKIGSMLAPLILSLERVSTVLPLAILGILTMSLPVMLIPLPETKGHVLLDTVESDENSNKETKDFNTKYKKVPTSTG
ncbi:organic cation transporter 1-like [Arctopsyche grandis]|uniref:organic cation transporter 1-like n=1 Tax=Arctopsyche grandis TaxID=121162 RepID=UPI00406D6DD8